MLKKGRVSRPNLGGEGANLIITQRLKNTEFKIT